MTLDIAKARALCEAATAGPWHENEDGGHVYDTSAEMVASIVQCSADTAFIAAARTLLPAALDEVERLRTRVAELEEFIGHNNEQLQAQFKDMVEQDQEMVGLRERIMEAVAHERERCAVLAETQQYYPDTHTGTRQEWVKQQIAEKIRRPGSVRVSE